MASEQVFGWSHAKMTSAQIKKLLQDQALARTIANKKIADAKKSEEWKKEQKILAELEKKLETWDIDNIKIS